MKLAAVLLARVIFFVESVDLNPRGDAYYPDIIKALVERYNFLSFPQKVDDLDEQKGVTLATGKLEDKTIEKVVIFNWGITLETTSSTDNSEALLQDALVWSAKNLRLHYDPSMIKRKSYISHITFYSDAPLLSLNPILDVVGKKLGATVSANLKLPYVFHPQGVSFGVDPVEQRIPIQQFSVERRQGIAFSENKYFSAAPVPTNTHCELLEELEKATKNAHSRND